MGETSENLTALPSPRSGTSRRELLWIFVTALVASFAAIVWSWKNRAFLLYGDAEAHMHVARRLFDSHRPGITQLGSVWLPLSHLILVPFVAVDAWWRSGFAPVIPSAACYLLGCVGLYRLARKWVSPAAACMGLALFAANPNLLYLQTTAMTEPLFLCELIWSVLLLVEWYQSLDGEESMTRRLQWAAILVLVAAVYTRYDGWILAFLAWIAMAVCLYRRGRMLRRDFLLASVVLAAAPASWFLYNAVTFGDWLEFQRGPYSAKAIELRTASTATNPHPGWHNPWVAFTYFLKNAEMDVAALGWGEFVAAAAVFGTGWTLWRGANTTYFDSELQFIFPLHWLRLPRRYSTSARLPEPFAIRLYDFSWTLLLWLPVPFYAYSVSYGSVPIFLPVWQPYSYYNTRYGMELLPAFAFFTCFAVQAVFDQLAGDPPIWKREALLLISVLLGANFDLMLNQKPLVYEEAARNAQSRGYYNRVIAESLGRLHAADPGGTFLMDTSNYPSIVPHAGLTYRETINESDKEFYWAALGAPASHADVVVTFGEGDIAKAVREHPEHLHLYEEFHPLSKAWDQADVRIYLSDRFPNPPLPVSQ